MDGQINQFDNARFTANLVNWLGRSNKAYVEPSLPAFKNRNFLPEEENEALKWIGDNLNDEIISCWWEEGQFLKDFGGKPLLKNATEFSIKHAGNPFLVINKPFEDEEKEKDVASLYLTQDINEFKEIMGKNNSDYFLLVRQYLESLPSFVIMKYQLGDYSNPEINKYSCLAFECNKEINDKYGCGPNSLSQEEMELLPTTYITRPNQIYAERMPLYLYKSKDNSIIYFINDATNKTIVVRMWFNDAELSNDFETVFENSETKIIKVK